MVVLALSYGLWYMLFPVHLNFDVSFLNGSHTSAVEGEDFPK